MRERSHRRSPGSAHRAGKEEGWRLGCVSGKKEGAEEAEAAVAEEVAFGGGDLGGWPGI